MSTAGIYWERERMVAWESGVGRVEWRIGAAIERMTQVARSEERRRHSRGKRCARPGRAIGCAWRIPSSCVCAARHGEWVMQMACPVPEYTDRMKDCGARAVCSASHGMFLNTWAVPRARGGR